VAQKFLEKGYSKVYALKGGWDEWHEAKYPTEKK
jgi:rhodanese-related sulfurtransferase